MPDSSKPAAGTQPDDSSVAASPVASVWLRVSTSLLSVLHFAVLGTVFPMLPVYLRLTLRLSWTQTGIALAALPLGLIVAPLIERVARQTGLDARSGLAISHLLAAGLAMTAASGLAAQPDPSTTFWMACVGLTLYSIVLSPALLWLPQATGQRDSLSTTSWRLWGAIGFVAPAWLLETVLIRNVELHDLILSYEILPAVAGWVGAFAVVAALLVPGEPLQRATATASNAGSGAGADGGSGLGAGPRRASTQSFGFGFVLSFVLIVFVQRCHQLWTAPLIASLVSETTIEVPMVHRLTVVSQVFEAIGMYCLAVLLVMLRPRFTACLGALTWAARAMLIGWVTQSSLPPQQTLAWLFLAQVLQGVALIGFFGGLAALAGRDLHQRLANRTALLSGFTGTAGLIAAGALTATFTGNAGGVFQWVVARLPLSVDLNGFEITLRGWPAVWWLSSIPALLAAVAVLFARSHSDPDER